MSKSIVSLRKAMDDAGLSQAELARELEVSDSQVTRWLKRETVPQPATAVKLSRLLNIPLESIFLSK